MPRPMTGAWRCPLRCATGSSRHGLPPRGGPMPQGAKRVYYLSMEFLIGRLLRTRPGQSAASTRRREGADRRFGLDPMQIIADEPDAALGNGGLGRLAACFLESLSTLGVPAHGYGIRYEHGLFRAAFRRWPAGREARGLAAADSRLGVRAPRSRLYRIGFGGEASVSGSRAGTGRRRHGRGLRHAHCRLERRALGQHAAAVVGQAGRCLRPRSFNRATSSARRAPRPLARTISRVLYPDDTTQGKELRLKQEYFFTAASLADILRRF
jgi:starch phosphorylase